MVFSRKFILLVFLVSGIASSSAIAGVFEALSRGAYFLSSGGACSGYDQAAASSALSKAECEYSTNASGVLNQVIEMSKLGEKIDQQLIKNPEDQYFALLAKQHSLELVCAGKFAQTVALGIPDVAADINMKVKLLRDVKQLLVKASQDIAKNPNISSKICPLSAHDLEPSEDSYAACTVLIKLRSSYQTILGSIPLSNVPKISSFLENYANLKDGPELKKIEAALDSNIQKAYLEGKNQVLAEATKMNTILEKEGAAGFDRNARHALLSDPLVVSRVIENGGSDKDLKGLACYADSRYGKGADSLNTGLMVGSLAISAGVGTLARVGSVGFKIAEGATAARSAGLISLNGMRALQVSAATVQGVSAYSTIDKTCFAGNSPQLLAKAKYGEKECVSAPNVQQLSQDSCVLAVSLSALGFSNIASVHGKELFQKLKGSSQSIKAADAEISAANTVANTSAKGSGSSKFIAESRGPGVGPKDVITARKSIREVDEKLLKGSLDAPEYLRLNISKKTMRSHDADHHVVNIRPASQEIDDASAKGLVVDGTEALDHEYGHAIFTKNMSRYSTLWKKQQQLVEESSEVKGTLEYRKNLQEIGKMHESEMALFDQKLYDRLPVSDKSYRKWQDANRKKIDEAYSRLPEDKLLTSEERRQWLLEHEISTEYQEVFADLIPALKRNDAAAGARAMKVEKTEVGGRDFSKRFSAPRGLDNNEEHHSLDAVRNFVWNKYFINPKNSESYPQMLEKVHKVMAEEVLERAGNKQLYQLPRKEKIRRLIEKLKTNMHDFE